MDKETLSNYGWIVICVMVLAVMIALATPFGSFVSEAVQSTTKGLFDVNKNALDAAGITIDDNAFVEGNGGAGENGGSSGSGGNTETIQSAATFSDGTSLTWEELKLAENGTKYGYKASAITDTSIGDWAFDGCDLTSITIPDSVTSISKSAFEGCFSLTDVYYTGTEEQWNAITIGNTNRPLTDATIHCTGQSPVIPEPPSNPETTFTFTIDETTYQAEEGMKWEKWVDSSYNTDGFAVFNSVISIEFAYPHQQINLDSYTAVQPTDEIIPNHSYSFGMTN